MRVIVAAAVLAAFAAPAFAENAKVSAAADALAALQKDAAKVKAYCEMQVLFDKAEQAAEKKKEDESKKFGKEAEEKAKALGEDFEKVMALEEEVNPDTAEGKKFFAALEAVEKSCEKK